MAGGLYDDTMQGLTMRSLKEKHVKYTDSITGVPWTIYYYK